MDRTEVLVVGAGLAGLSLAARLREAGREVLLLDRGRRPGGRCASRALSGEIFDHGPVYAHGREPGFLDLVRASGAEAGLVAWPKVTLGAGTPCNVEAVGIGVERLAPMGGMNELPAYLARGLTIRPSTRVGRLVQGPGRLRAEAENLAVEADTLVLALPPPQALLLLRSLAGPPLQALTAVLELVPYVASLAVALRYPLEVPPPPFDLCLPREAREPVQLIAHESAKRARPSSRVIMLQGRPAWSRLRLEDDPALWSSELRSAAAQFYPALRDAPLEQYTHRWRHARMAGIGLAAPILVELPGGGRLGLTGEAFDPAGGLEGAWRAGRRLAEDILARGGST